MKLECIICRWQTHDFDKERYEDDARYHREIFNYAKNHIRAKHPEFYKNNMEWVSEKLHPIYHSSGETANE